MSGPLFDSIAKAIAELPVDKRKPPAIVESSDRARNMHRFGLPVLYGGMMADAMTTAMAMRSGGKEANPVLAPLPMLGIMAAKGAANGMAGWALDKAAHKGSKWATPVAIGLGAIQSVAAAHNAKRKKR